MDANGRLFLMQWPDVNGKSASSSQLQRRKKSMPTLERTLTIVKPDGVSKGVIGDVLMRFEGSGLRIVALKMLSLSPEEAGGFYKVHLGKPFYPNLREYMSSGPVVVVVLEGEDAISRTRGIMGATNPADAAPGTIRADHAESIERNIVHGSDSPESAAYEIPYFFSEMEIYDR
jgi:nucleoside-diphosphate kinase